MIRFSLIDINLYAICLFVLGAGSKDQGVFYMAFVAGICSIVHFFFFKKQKVYESIGECLFMSVFLMVWLFFVNTIMSLLYTLKT